ncbi:MAG TPA: hypothetical protein VJ044_17215 [Candidatus Hodarchaeales archaeon]|nr:hypothetical protein [Candidatus Hodarchaeales archaeon]
MANKIKFNFQGQEVWGERISVQDSRENWSQYLLEDGSTLKMKIVVTEVLRIDGQYDAEGNPVYFVKSANIISVIAPEELMKKT